MKFLVALLLGLALASSASAATLISTASGNINATGTWNLIDTGTYLNSESANTALTTSPVASSTFIPPAKSIIEVGVKVASVVASPSGTMMVKLANATSPGSRECTQTVNVADLPANASPTSVGGPDGGFIFFSCAATPNGTDSYTISASTSVAAQVNLFSSATTNWDRALVTTDTQANGPAAGDKIFVNGVLTGAGTHSAFTVTVNTTANISYGNVANTSADPSLSVGQFGTLAYATTSATNFTAEVAGPIVVYNGGTFTVGTSGSPIPMSASCTDTVPCGVFKFNTSVEGDTGLTCRNGSTCSSAGQPRTVGKAIWQTHLFANIAAGAVGNCFGSAVPCLSVSDDTGWQNGDVFVLAATDKISNTAHSEKLTLNANATATALPVSTTLSFPHLGQIVSYTSTNTGMAYTFPEQAEIVLLTRNVRFQGASDTQPGYIYCAPTANCTFDWTEFKWIGGTVEGQYGLESETTPGGTWSLTNSSMHDVHDAGIVLGSTQNTWGGTPSVPALTQNVALWNVDEASNAVPVGCSFNLTWTSNPNSIIDHVTDLSTPAQNDGFCIRSYNVQFTNIVCGDIQGGGICLDAINAAQGIGYTIRDWGPLTFHSNNDFDTLWAANTISGTINGIYVYNSYGWFFNSQGFNITVDPFYGIPNGVLTGSKGNGDFTFRNGFLASSSGVGRAPLAFDEGFNVAYLDNMDLCPAQNVTLTDITGAHTNQSLFITCAGTGTATTINPVNDVGLTVASTTTPKIVGRNTAFFSGDDALAPGLFGQYFMTADSYICTDWATNHECFMTYGVAMADTTISSGFNSSFTERLWPIVPRFTASSSGTALTTSGNTYPINIMSPNMFVFGTTTTFPTGTQIINGGAPTWTLNNSVSAASQTMMGSAYANQNCTLTPSPCRLQSAPLGGGVKAAANSGHTITECVKVRESLNTDPNFTFDGATLTADTYNGEAPRLILRRNPQMGIASDTVLATYTASAGTTQQICGTTPAAPHDGMFEFVVDADMTATSNTNGFVNEADWSSVQN